MVKLILSISICSLRRTKDQAHVIKQKKRGGCLFWTLIACTIIVVPCPLLLTERWQTQANICHTGYSSGQNFVTLANTQCTFALGKTQKEPDVTHLLTLNGCWHTIISRHHLPANQDRTPSPFLHKPMPSFPTYRMSWSQSGDMLVLVKDQTPIEAWAGVTYWVPGAYFITTFIGQMRRTIKHWVYEHKYEHKYVPTSENANSTMAEQTVDKRALYQMSIII